MGFWVVLSKAQARQEGTASRIQEEDASVSAALFPSQQWLHPCDPQARNDIFRISLGTTRKDGVRRLVFRLHTRPSVDLSQEERPDHLRYATRDFQARLVVEVDVPDKPGEATVGVDIGEDWLIAADFCDGSRYLICGRLLNHRYWQKVRAKVKPPSQNHPKMSRRYRQIARKEARQITDALHHRQQSVCR